MRVQYDTLKAIVGDASNPSIMFHDMELMECGCKAIVGVRMDLNEKALAFIHCPDHGPQMKRVRERFATMPPSPRPALDVAAELMEQELVVSGAARR